MVIAMKKSLWIFLTATLAIAADWPAWRGPQRNGISAEKFSVAHWPPTGPKVLWKTNVGVGCATVSVARDRVYAMGNRNDNDIVWCLDAATGKVLWKHQYPESLDASLYEGGVNATPTVDGDRVYTLSRNGYLFCLNAETGAVIWRKHLLSHFGVPTPKWEGGKEGWGHAGSPLVHGDLLLLNGLAVRKTTGDLAWKSDDPPAYSSPIVAFTNIVLVFHANGLSLREVATGKLIARHEWITRYNVNAATPIVEGDKIFISSGYNRGATLLQFRDGTLTPLWETKKMRNQLATSILWEGHLYGINEDIFTCMEFLTGEVKWTGGEGIRKGSLILADGKLIILGETGTLVIAEALPEAYKELARVKVLDGHCWSLPVLANGRLYCKTIPGDLVCLDAK